MRVCPGSTLSQKIIVAVGFLVLIGFIMPAMALPPGMEADKLLLAAAAKLDSMDYEAAGQDLEKIRALKVELPVEYYFQNGRYLAATKQAAEARRTWRSIWTRPVRKGNPMIPPLNCTAKWRRTRNAWHGSGITATGR